MKEMEAKKGLSKIFEKQLLEKDVYENNKDSYKHMLWDMNQYIKNIQIKLDDPNFQVKFRGFWSIKDSRTATQCKEQQEPKEAVYFTQMEVFDYRNNKDDPKKILLNLPLGKLPDMGEQGTFISNNGKEKVVRPIWDIEKKRFWLIGDILRPYVEEGINSSIKSICSKLNWSIKSAVISKKDLDPNEVYANINKEPKLDNRGKDRKVPKKVELLAHPVRNFFKDLKNTSVSVVEHSHFDADVQFDVLAGKFDEKGNFIKNEKYVLNSIELTGMSTQRFGSGNEIVAWSLGIDSRIDEQGNLTKAFIKANEIAKGIQFLPVNEPTIKKSLWINCEYFTEDGKLDISKSKDGKFAVTKITEDRKRAVTFLTEMLDKETLQKEIDEGNVLIHISRSISPTGCHIAKNSTARENLAMAHIASSSETILLDPDEPIAASKASEDMSIQQGLVKKAERKGEIRLTDNENTIQFSYLLDSNNPESRINEYIALEDLELTGSIKKEIEEKGYTSVIEDEIICSHRIAKYGVPYNAKNVYAIFSSLPGGIEDQVKISQSTAKKFPLVNYAEKTVMLKSNQIASNVLSDGSIDERIDPNTGCIKEGVKFNADDVCMRYWEVPTNTSLRDKILGVAQIKKGLGVPEGWKHKVVTLHALSGIIDSVKNIHNKGTNKYKITVKEERCLESGDKTHIWDSSQKKIAKVEPDEDCPYIIDSKTKKEIYLVNFGGSEQAGRGTGVENFVCLGKQKIYWNENGETKEGYANIYVCPVSPFLVKTYSPTKQHKEGRVMTLSMGLHIPKEIEEKQRELYQNPKVCDKIEKEVNHAVDFYFARGR